MRGVGAGLHAALLLARGRAEGLFLLVPPADAPPEAATATAARSFWAAAFCLPATVLLHWLDRLSLPPASRGPLFDHGFALDLLGFAIGWLAFALASHAMANRLGRARLWPRFIAAWNWCNVVQNLLLIAGSLPVLAGAPTWFSQATWLVATGWALWLEWFASRLALELPPLTAAALVALDIAIGLGIVLATVLAT